MRLSVIIPAFNEEERLPATLDAVLDCLNKAGLNQDAELLVIDDGSDDRTADTVTQRLEPNIRLIRHQRNLGKGRAVKTGVSCARGENILFMDADNSTCLQALPVFMAKLEHGCDVVIGSRAVAGAQVLVAQNLIKVFLGKAGNLVICWLLGLSVKDSQCGFKLFSAKAKKLFARQTVAGWGFDFEILFLAKKSGLIVAELPIIWINSQQSKVKSFDYLKTFIELLKIKVNDLRGAYEKN